jgi:hypothetical protein
MFRKGKRNPERFTNRKKSAEGNRERLPALWDGEGDDRKKSSNSGRHRSGGRRAESKTPEQLPALPLNSFL